jgi:hypothetical protein
METHSWDARQRRVEALGRCLGGKYVEARAKGSEPLSRILETSVRRRVQHELADRTRELASMDCQEDGTDLDQSIHLSPMVVVQAQVREEVEAETGAAVWLDLWGRMGMGGAPHLEQESGGCWTGKGRHGLAFPEGMERGGAVRFEQEGGGLHGHRRWAPLEGTGRGGTARRSPPRMSSLPGPSGHADLWRYAPPCELLG